jgi:hypothetical protein
MPPSCGTRPRAAVRVGAPSVSRAGQARSTHRHEVQASDWETRLEARVLELAARYGRYG